MLIPELFLRVAKVETYLRGQLLTNASGFFFRWKSKLYLITNRHVCRDDAVGHQPDSLKLQLHTHRDDPKQNGPLTIPLYENNLSRWKAHPSNRAEIDVVAVPLADDALESKYQFSSFGAEDVLGSDETLPPGQQVLIIGFPLGFHDTLHNLPLVRQAVVASEFAHPFKGDPYFVTDARTHRGTSGSPVVTKLRRPTAVAGQFEDRWCLLGVHAATLDVSNRDPLYDDRLGLNVTWYASLIPEIIDGAIPANQKVVTNPERGNTLPAPPLPNGAAGLGTNPQSGIASRPAS
ncbi:MAG: serine protease [Planctomyces sp.]|jgi:hypothetical protein|nr:serine protease [Planctomyces sp.]